MAGPHVHQMTRRHRSTDDAGVPVTAGKVAQADGIGGVIWGDASSAGGSGMVPYYIAPAETFTVPEFKQALYSEAIDNEGTLDVDGLLIEVD